jgi:ankyrin repeat protein
MNFFGDKSGSDMRPRTLKAAAERGDLDAVKYHLSQGADINGTTAAGHFALDGAIINDHPHVVEYLIANGADINKMSEFRWSPLYVAAWAGSIESAALLLLAGAKMETKTLDGPHSPDEYTPLHIAAVNGRLAVVLLLIGAGANVEARTGSGETALDLARQCKHTAVVKLLKRVVSSRRRIERVR